MAAFDGCPKQNDCKCTYFLANVHAYAYSQYSYRCYINCSGFLALVDIRWWLWTV